MNLSKARDDVEEVLSRCLPGQTVLAWYSDDDVFHERLLVWRVDDKTWYVLTPDGDCYAEDYSGDSDNGPLTFQVKGVDFQFFSRVRRPVYRFREYPTDSEFKQHVETALRDLGLLGRTDLGWQPRHAMNMNGDKVEATEYLGRLLVPRRVRGRDQGHLQLPVEQEESQRGRGPQRADAAPAGKVWLAMHSTPDFQLGAEVVDSLAQSVLLSPNTCAVEGPKGWTLCKLVKVAESPDFVSELREKNRASLKEDIGPVAGEPDQKPAAPGDEAQEAEDARTLAVEYDDQGERFKLWRDVCRECREYAYPDWPHEGPQSVLHLIKHMHKHGGSPKLWLQSWARFKGIQENDRVMHEMRALMEVLEHGGCYDQLNLTSLASMESVGRRVQSIVDAYNSGSSTSPDWGAAKIISGYAGPEDVVMPSLRSWAARKGKEEVELAAARTKIREYKKLAVPMDEAAGAVADGSMAAGGAGLAPERKAKAKPLAPPASS